jgi:hypothetical protein
MDSKDLEVVIKKNSMKRHDGFVELNPTAVDVITNIMQQSFQIGQIMQENTQLKQKNENLQKMNNEQRKQVQNLEQKTYDQSRQLDDYSFLVMQMIRSMHHAEERKKLAKMFKDHADKKNLVYDNAELLNILLE